MKLDLKFSFSWNEKVSSGLAFVFIALLSLLVAWMAVNAGQEIIDNPPQAIVKSEMVDN